MVITSDGLDRAVTETIRILSYGTQDYRLWIYSELLSSFVIAHISFNLA